MTIALILAFAAVVFACWLLFTLATLALPVFVAITIGMWAQTTGSEPLAAVAFGLLAGVAALLAGQFLFTVIRSPMLRLGLGLLFAVPAAIAGYHAVHGITGVGIESEIWRQVLGYAGAIFIGASAWLRVAGGGELARRIEQSAPSRS